MINLHDPASEDAAEEPHDGYKPVTVQDVYKSLRKQGYEPSCVILSKDGEQAFVMIGRTWQRIDLTDDWRPFDPVHGSVSALSIEEFYAWLGKDRERVKREGRRIGENAMKTAIRSLIGAASLVDLDSRNEDNRYDD